MLVMSRLGLLSNYEESTKQWMDGKIYWDLYNSAFYDPNVFASYPTEKTFSCKELI